jgi:hypothetical protein
MKQKNKKGSNKKNADRFPGYKNYPEGEDILQKGERIEGDIEDLMEDRKTIPSSDIKKKKNALSRDGNKPFNEDEEFKGRVTPVDFEGKDLDVPGSELDDDQEDIGSEDEENNLYSLGGDSHDDDEHRE